MKTLTFLFISLLLSLVILANTEKNVNSKVKNVTVFLNSAQVCRTASFNIDAGVTELIYDGVSPHLIHKSIQVKGTGKYVILDVQYKIKYPELKEPIVSIIPPRIIQNIKLLEDSLAFLNFDIETINAKKDALELEKKILLQNKFMQGNVDTIPELKIAMEYLRKQLSDINIELNKIKRQSFLFLKEQSRQQLRLNELKAYNKQVNPIKQENPKHQIVVTVSAEFSAQGTMNIEYMVNNAGWTPEYDIRAESTSKPISLIYKANVFQNSGENWENIKLKLSTITPNQTNYKPVLPILYLNYYTHNIAVLESINKKRESKMTSTAGSILSTTLDYAKDDEYFAPAVSSAQYTQAQQTMTNVEYDISLGYSIPSDGQYHKVSVQEYELKTEYYHYLVPRLDKQAYLIAKISEWEKLELLPAMANIYFEGTYVGETQINTNTMLDTLELALGKDRSIIVDRKKDIESVRNVLIGGNIVKTVSYNINGKNNKLSNCNIIIEDQIPISQNNEIIIKPIDLSKGELNKTTGMIRWQSKINSKESTNFKFSYEIEYNKDKQLANL